MTGSISRNRAKAVRIIAFFECTAFLRIFQRAGLSVWLSKFAFSLSGGYPYLSKTGGKVA